MEGQAGGWGCWCNSLDGRKKLQWDDGGWNLELSKGFMWHTGRYRRKNVWCVPFSAPASVFDKFYLFSFFVLFRIIHVMSKVIIYFDAFCCIREFRALVQSIGKRNICPWNRLEWERFKEKTEYCGRKTRAIHHIQALSIPLFCARIRFTMLVHNHKILSCETFNCVLKRGYRWWKDGQWISNDVCKLKYLSVFFTYLFPLSFTFTMILNRRHRHRWKYL